MTRVEWISYLYLALGGAIALAAGIIVLTALRGARPK